MVSGPLEKLYSRDLKLMQGGAASQQLFAARRSAMTEHSFATALEILGALHDDSLMQRLGMAPAAEAPAEAPLQCEGWAGMEAKLLGIIHDFSCALAGELIWTHAYYHWCFPFCAAVYLLPTETEREQGCNKLREIADAIIKAEAVERPSAALKQCLWDLSWHREQLPRHLLKHGLSNRWNANDSQMRDFISQLFAGTSSTKEVLESTFNYMQRQIGFMSTNHRASDAMRWLLATTSPYAFAGGATQTLPRESDWWHVLSTEKGRQLVQDAVPRWFCPNATPMPPKKHDDEEEFATPAKLQKLAFRAAGNPALNRSAAATAYLVSEYQHEFRNVASCWAGHVPWNWGGVQLVWLCLAQKRIGQLLS